MAGRSKVSISRLRSLKRERQKFAVLTCYDYSTAQLMEAADLDAILVGDTYGEVCLGFDSTIPVTIDQLITVAAAVRRGAPNVFLIGDMPYLTYQVCPNEAVRNAGRFMSEAGCDCIKVEVDRRLADTVAAMATATIPVMAHLGLRPQSLHQLGGYKAQGKTAESAERIIEDAAIMEHAGAIALLLEAVPSQVAGIVTESTSLPVIGCAAGPHCDAQVVVMHDMLGYAAGHPPSHVKTYAQMRKTLSDAFASYVDDVRQAEFPSEDKSIVMDSSEFAELRRRLSSDGQFEDAS